MKGVLKYAHKGVFGWDHETIDSSSDNLGWYTSIAVDECDYPHISYSDEANLDLKYAYLSLEKMGLSGHQHDGLLVLTWAPEQDADAYWVYGAANRPHFVPGAGPGYEHRIATLSAATTTWQSSDGIGDPTINWVYLIIAIDSSDQEINRSNRVGEYDFAGDIP